MVFARIFGLIFLCLVLGIPAVRANAILSDDGDGRIVFATDEPLSDVVVCPITGSVHCLALRRSAPGVYTGAALRTDQPSLYVVRFMEHGRPRIMVRDLRANPRSDQSDNSSEYVVIGALIGFVGTVAVEAIRGVALWFSSRRGQIRQFRRNVFDVRSLIEHGELPRESDFARDLDTRGITIVADHLRRAQGLLTDFRLHQIDRIRLLSELDALYVQRMF
jgi:hypothetical protein